MHTETTEAIVVAEPAQITAGGREVFMPIMEADDVMRRHVALANFRDQALKPSVDYGIIPGTGNKPTLLKPGAEKLCTLFGLSCSFSVVEKTEDWTGEAHGGRPFFYYWYRCELRRGDYLVAATDGSCNSLEKKYARHYSPPDLVNTLQKMAQKRALVGATLLAVNASEFFTQDVEDMDLGHQGTQPAARPQSTPAARQSPTTRPVNPTPPAARMGGSGKAQVPHYEAVGIISKAYPAEGNRPDAIVIDGERYSTFDKTVGGEAVTFEGHEVRVVWKPGREYQGKTQRDLVSIEGVHQQQAAPPLDLNDPDADPFGLD